MKTLIIFACIVLGMSACKKEKEVTPAAHECPEEFISPAESMYYKLARYEYKFINNPKISGYAIPGYSAMFDLNPKGGEFVLAKGFTPYRLILMLDTANYEVLSISDTAINLNDGLYIKR